MTLIASEPGRAAPRMLALVPSLGLPSLTADPATLAPGEPDGGHGSLAVVAVAVVATDPVSRVGLSVSLRELPGVRLLMGSADTLPAGTQVVIVAGEQIDLALCDSVRDLRAEHCVRVLICTGSVDEPSLTSALHAGAGGVLRRAEASAETLGRAVRAVARGKQVLPGLEPGAQGSAVSSPTVDIATTPDHPRRGNPLTTREAAVLRLIADGFDTREIAVQLCYSERTVKNVIHTITTRLMLRNRAHAVAYALRHQLI